MNLQSRTQRGVGLVEAMIAALVFALGIGALVKLQGTYFQSGSNANARATATSLAQAKLDELRTWDFSTITGTNVTDNPTPASGTAFTYTRKWTAFDYYYDNSTPPALTWCGDPSTCAAGDVDQKLIAVTVSWNDPDTNNDTVTVTSVINKNPASTSGSLIGYAPGGSGEKPVRFHNPGLQPDVVPIAISNNLKKETSKPTPDVSSNLDYTETYFEVASYKAGGELIRSEEFLTINCACQQDSTADTGLSPSRQALKTDTTGKKYLEYVEGKAVTGKAVGTRISSGQKGQQSELCNECCRDHHDKTGQSVLYDPFRASTDYNDANGDHNHYDLDNSGQFVLANGNNDTYMEACRMKRIDGVWRVMQDWRVANIKIMPETTLTSPTNLADYQNYVKSYIQDYLTAISTGSDNSSAITPSTVWTNEPNTYDLGLDATLQLVARAIYVDFMDSEMVNTLKSLHTTTGSGFNGDEILQLIPFYEINVTKLANWSSTAPTVAGRNTDPDFNEPLQTNNAHGRGRVTGNTAGTASISAFIEMSNTGLTDTQPIDPQDITIANGRTDSLDITVSGSPPPPSTISISGVITVGNNTDISPSDVQVASSNPADGNCTTTQSGTTYGYFCTLNSGITSITIIFSHYNASSTQGNSTTITDNLLCAWPCCPPPRPPPSRHPALARST